jgi:diguanylate cyclase (GGDEF)-like protein
MRLLRRCLPASLRGQFTLALAALVALALASGAAATASLQRAALDLRNLTEVRLARLQAAQNLLQRTLAIERRSDELMHARAAAQAAAAHAAVGEQLDGFDAAVHRLAADDADLDVLDLHQASQLFRNGANVAAELRAKELRVPAAAAAAAQHAPPGVGADLHALPGVVGELHAQAEVLVGLAQRRSARLTDEYRDAVQRLSDTAQRTQTTVIVLLGFVLVTAGAIVHLFGRLVLARLHDVSQRLQGGAAAAPGEDEIGHMARAVERFLADRRQLEREIGERLRAERLQAGQARVLELIAVNTPLPEVLDLLCRLIEAQLPGTMASVLLYHEAGRCLRHGAGPSLPEAYMRQIDGVVVGACVGSCGTAVHRRAPVIVADIASDPLWAAYGSLALAHGLRSCWSAPIMSPGDAVLGTFALYKGQPGTPGAAERELIALAAHVAGIAIERHAAQQRIHHLAHHDELTGLGNRVGLEARLQQAFERSRAAGRGVSLAYIDLDNFKAINDSLGHHAGDTVLREVAARLQAGVRGSDTAVRLGGDEFLVVFTDQPADEPTLLAVRLQALRDEVARPIEIGGRGYRVTCSMGVASHPRDAQDVAALLSCADTALYRAKEGGRDAFQFYSAELDAHTQGQLALREDLRQAIERGELRLVYQPQVDAASSRITGVEALLRWHHPERGLVAPGAFIPLAEASGLIVEIGDWVLRTACRQARAWQDNGLPPLTMAVNVSARQLRDADGAARVAAALAENRLAPACLEIELTETMIMENQEPVLKSMRALHAQGVGIAIDDFGTGYSSLGALKSFPLTRLKIDRSFIHGLADEGGAAIVEAIVALGQKLGLQVVAEGVETAAQWQLLQRAGCDAMQGYLFGRPVPPEEIEGLLQQQRTARAHAPAGAAQTLSPA